MPTNLPPGDPSLPLKQSLRTPAGTSTSWFNSYSGSDTQITVIMKLDDVNEAQFSGNKLKDKAYEIYRPVGEIQTLSISSARNVYPVRRIGESHATEYTRGARTLAGTMVFATGENDFFAYLSARSKKERKIGVPFFMDEIPSFNILITCSNEYGHKSHSALTDVTITNWGTTHSESDMYLESSYTYVARYYHPHVSDPKTLATETGIPQNKLSSVPGRSLSKNNRILNMDAISEIISKGVFSEMEANTILDFMTDTYGQPRR